MTEEWRPVVEYEGYYEVSDQGRVRSVERTVHYADGRVRTYPSMQIRLSLSTTGYVRVNLSRGSYRTRKVHQLVAEAFLGRVSGADVCHNNGIRTDNRLTNLRYDTRSNNLKDAVYHGTNKNTAKSHCPRGHEYDFINSHGRRECSVCRAAFSHARYMASKVKAS